MYFFSFIVLFIPYLVLCDICQVEKEITYGTSTTTSGDCIEYGGCLKSSKCVYSNLNVAGFETMIGDSSNGVLISSEINISLKECSRKCLANINCNCFTFDTNSNTCKLKTESCTNFPSSSNTIISYSKLAFNRWTCYQGDCPFGHSSSPETSDLNNYENEINDCANACKLNSDCDLISVRRKKGMPRDTICYLKKGLCNFSLEDLREKVFDNICLPGPIYSNLHNHQDARLRNITDSESDETCVEVNLKETFNLRIPWPSVGYSNPDFRISIKGRNFRNCINTNDVIKGSGVLAYVKTEFQSKPEFSGDFFACNIVGGDDSTECTYSCTCGDDYCQAVYIRGFASSEDNMSICFYDILLNS